MADKGNPVIIFGGTTYDADDCIQVASFQKGAEDLTYRCSGYMKHQAGDKTISLNFSLALAATDTTKIAALAPGATGAVTYYPFGNTATYIKHSATRGLVISSPEGDSAGKIVTMDVTIAFDDLTSGAAT